MLDGNCTFNVLVYADADSEVPLEWGDSDAKEVKNAEKVMLRSFSTNSHRIDTVVSYRYAKTMRRARFPRLTIAQVERMRRFVFMSRVYVLALGIPGPWGVWRLAARMDGRLQELGSRCP